MHRPAVCPEARPAVLCLGQRTPQAAPLALSLSLCLSLSLSAGAWVAAGGSCASPLAHEVGAVDAQGDGHGCVEPPGGCVVGVFLATVAAASASSSAPHQEQLRAAMRAFARGVECAGDTVVVLDAPTYVPVDIAVVFSEVRVRSGGDTTLDAAPPMDRGFARVYTPSSAVATGGYIPPADSTLTAQRHTHGA
jgi:hypothetical protein